MKPDKIPKIGTAEGPCGEECIHEDCSMIRAMAANLCYICGKAIGYAVGYYHLKDGFVHETCFEEIEKIKKSKKFQWPWGRKL